MLLHPHHPASFSPSSSSSSYSSNLLIILILHPPHHPHPLSSSTSSSSIPFIILHHPHPPSKSSSISSPSMLLNILILHSHIILHMARGTGGYQSGMERDGGGGGERQDREQHLSVTLLYVSRVLTRRTYEAADIHLKLDGVIERWLSPRHLEVGPVPGDDGSDLLDSL
ncbi:hypothetical protein FKM82_023011 [Ascaphus truei]